MSKKRGYKAWNNLNTVEEKSGAIRQVGQNLAYLAGQLTPQEVKKCLRGSLRKEATLVAKPARQALMGAMFNGRAMNNASLMARGIRAHVKRNLSGYVVSVAFKNYSYGFYQNGKHGKWGKPVLYWLNAGTDNRTTGRVKKAMKPKLNRGKIDGINFMGASIPAREQSIVRITQELEKRCIKMIQNYGDSN